MQPGTAHLAVIIYAGLRHGVNNPQVDSLNTSRHTLGTPLRQDTKKLANSPVALHLKHAATGLMRLMGYEKDYNSYHDY